MYDLLDRLKVTANSKEVNILHTGYLADVTGHYYAIFYFAGSVVFLAGLLAWILFYLTRKKGIRAIKVSLKTS